MECARRVFRVYNRCQLSVKVGCGLDCDHAFFIFFVTLPFFYPYLLYTLIYKTYAILTAARSVIYLPFPIVYKFSLNKTSCGKNVLIVCK